MVLFLLTFFSGEATALRMPLDPQTRIHAGLSLAEIDDLGVSVGMDSRLTRLLYVDVGAFVSVGDPGEEAASADGTEEELALRHGIFVAPGLRIPHQYGPGINWDLTGRGGFASVWSSDAADDFQLQADPALLAGADFLIRKDKIGFRACGRMLFYQTFSKSTRTEISMIRPQLALEAIYQW